MLINTANINGEQRVELYYSSGASFRYHTTRFMTNSLKDKWLSFDVTEPLQQWLKDKGSQIARGLMYMLLILCCQNEGDHEKSQLEHRLLSIYNPAVERVDNINFLSVQISDDLTWLKNSTGIEK
ncbi:hypothetical protein XENOCAPTIV_002079 [Xenoophorus captivus]|uniref:TGF-beta propeptide domain-containing protein n=1 Tax=Xenoophorus captivus TaxID=1517983 RepID=A0ABV0S6K2_9TELE